MLSFPGQHFWHLTRTADHSKKNIHCLCVAGKTPSHKKSRLFTEGWIEFLNKKIAKRTALLLNNTQIGGKKRSRWYSEIWNLKYLPRFKWGHLNERLAYERAVHQQRLRTEISQVKKETNFYIQNVEKRKILDKVEKREKAKGGELKRRKWEFTQKDTEEEILRKKTHLDSKDDEKTPSKQSAPERTKTAKKAKRKQDKASLEAKKAASDKNFLKNLFSGGLRDDEN